MDPISLGTGAFGGLIGGNVLGKIVGGGKVGIASGSLFGIIGGAAGQYYFADSVGPMISTALQNNPDALKIAANLLSGAGGGAALGIIWSIIRRIAG